MSVNFWVEIRNMQASILWRLPTSWRCLVPFGDAANAKHHAAFRVEWLGLGLRAQYSKW